MAHLPVWAAKLVTRALQRAPQQTWLPVSFQRAWTEGAARITRTPRDVTISTGTLGGRACDLVRPRDASEGRVVLYLHGGAYIVGSPRTHAAFAAQIARASGAEVQVLDYRLGPEHTHPAALDDAFAAYRELLELGEDGSEVVVAGDSAGAGLAVALACRLRDRGEPLPTGLILLNGLFDLAVDAPSTRMNARRDAGLRRDWTFRAGELYRGKTDASDPELSVLNADLRGLPPMYLQVGTHDLLLDHSQGLAERARRAGVPVTLSRFEGMWHDFQLGAGMVRPANEAVADLRAAFAGLWSGDGLGRDREGRPRIAIIGAGFGGVGLAMSLRRAGIDSFELFEKGAGVGGVWRDNTYPGAACDVPSHLYSFSFEPNPDWSRRYSPQAEILSYLERCVDRYGLREKIRLETEITGADFDESAAVWRLTTTGGEEIEAEVVVSACGQLSRPAVTRIPGADRFEGPIFHTARWRNDLDLHGRRVAVIGTGASTIQVVPAIAPEVGHLDVYQRSAPYVVRKMDREFNAWERALSRRFPPFRLMQRFKEWLVFEFAISIFSRAKPLGRLLARMSESLRDEQISDPGLRQALTPSHVVGCKRILISSDYYPAFERDNVELVSQGVREVTATGVVADDGTERPADAIVLSTGFESTQFLAPMEIRGREGAELNEVWRDGAEAYLGMTVAGFPNLFIMYGPNTNLGSGSIVFQLESQMRYIVEAIRRLAANGGTLAVRPQVQREFDRRVQARLANSVWQTGCSNWYVDENGRNSNNWPGFTLEYRLLTRRLDLDDYEVSSAPGSGAYSGTVASISTSAPIGSAATPTVVRAGNGSEKNSA